MFSQMSVSHSVHEGVGIVVPMSFPGDGYLWYQVPSGLGMPCSKSLSDGWACPGVGMSGGMGMSRTGYALQTTDT